MAKTIKSWYVLEFRNGSYVEFAQSNGECAETRLQAEARKLTPDEAKTWAETATFGINTADGWEVKAELLEVTASAGICKCGNKFSTISGHAADCRLHW